MIHLTSDRKARERAICRAREGKILIPTFREQMFPGSIPPEVREKLKGIGLGEIHPLNLFWIT